MAEARMAFVSAVAACGAPVVIAAVAESRLQCRTDVDEVDIVTTAAREGNVDCNLSKQRKV
jgi:hypothetical protein